VGLHGLDAFADVYGFVARDDVMRAVALMLNHVSNESQDPNAFVGHLDDNNFFVIIAPDKVEQIKKALAVRLEEAMAFFYPRSDWEAGQTNPDAQLPRLEVAMGVLGSSKKSFSKLADLKQASLEAQETT
jgi:GGDEF domain-containing protein